MATFDFYCQASAHLLPGLDFPLPFLLPLFLIATLTGLSTLLFVLEYLESGRVCDHLYFVTKPS
jgi:hypothetical protein